MARPMINAFNMSNPNIIGLDTSLIDYIDLLYNLMGIDIKYEDFQKMSDGERKQFIRDIKINKIINE